MINEHLTISPNRSLDVLGRIHTHESGFMLWQF